LGVQEGDWLACLHAIAEWCAGTHTNLQLALALEPEHFGLARAPTRGYSRPSGTKISVPETYPQVQGTGHGYPQG
jgi:hypothetical protein